MLSSIREGLQVDQHTVPDGSVGKIWSTYWKENKLAEAYGERTKYPHKFPDDYPQSGADVEVWIYPTSALGSFRVWLESEYIPKKYPAYMNRKAKQGAIPPSRVDALLAAVAPRQLGE